MREIKVKGWDGINMLPPQDLSQSQKYWTWLGRVDAQLLEFTGFKDRNHKEIYEGDLVQYTEPYAKDPSNPFQSTFKVLWDEKHHCWMCDIFIPIEEELALGDFDGSDLEVIGNIFENKDLCTN